MAVLAETGLRFGELQFLRPDDLDWRRGRILVRMKKVTGPLHPEMQRLLDRHGCWWPKDETNRYVFMTPRCYEILEQVCPAGSKQAWVFQDGTGLPIQDQGTRERLQRYATKTGIMLIKPENGKHAGKTWSRANWRMFRNYFVSQAASAGMSLIHVMEATGHDSYEMVRHYFRLNEDAYRQDFKKFNSGLAGIDPNGRGVTQESNTLGTHSTGRPLSNKDLGTERAGFEPAVRAFTRTPV
jgi:integrase